MTASLSPRTHAELCVAIMAIGSYRHLHGRSGVVESVSVLSTEPGSWPVTISVLEAGYLVRHGDEVLTLSWAETAQFLGAAS